MACCEVTGGLFASQITFQWTLWSSMISVSWVTNCFQVNSGLPRLWVVSPFRYNSLCLYICLLPNSSEYFNNWNSLNPIKLKDTTGYLGIFPGTAADSQRNTLKAHISKTLVCILKKISASTDCKIMVWKEMWKILKPFKNRYIKPRLFNSLKTLNSPLTIHLSHYYIQLITVLLVMLSKLPQYVGPLPLHPPYPALSNTIILALTYFWFLLEF